MDCTICGKKITLIPSAAERARKDIAGNPASYYTALFTTHPDCQIRKSREDVLNLMRRLRG
jgi:hypothetical protein